MKQVVTLSNGVKVEVTEKECKILFSGEEEVRINLLKRTIKGNEFLQEEDAWLKYFSYIGIDERKVVELWILQQVPQTAKQKKFLEVVNKALNIINYNYSISNIEISEDLEKKIYFKEYAKVLVSLSPQEWQTRIMSFSEEYQSNMATLYELFLWYAYRIAKGYWRLSYVCDDSGSQGNYWSSPYSTQEIEVAGLRKVGGAIDGVGNTYKLVTNEKGFVLCGGSCYTSGKQHPVGSFAVLKNNKIEDLKEYVSGVMVLRKV